MEQAAAQLGVKPDAIRKRLRRGSLRGQRVGTTWDVWLDEPPGEPFREPRATPKDGPQAAGHEPHHGSQAEPWRGALVDELRADVAYLRGALEREQIAHGETRRLMQQAVDSLRALPAPTEPAVAALPLERAEAAEDTPIAAEPPETSPVDLPLVRELKRAGVKGKKQRRRLLERLAGLWR